MAEFIEKNMINSKDPLGLIDGKPHHLLFNDSKEGNSEKTLYFVKRMGSGTACICYEVTLEMPIHASNKVTHKRMIFKQFYPNPTEFACNNQLDEKNHLTIEGYDNLPAKAQIEELSRKFVESYELQLELEKNDGPLKDFIIAPVNGYFNGLTRYALYPYDSGKTLDLQAIGIKDYIDRLQKLAKVLNALHEQRYLYMDLKLDNILETYSKQIKLFDFDATIDLNHLDQVQESDIRHANDGGVAPELRNELKSDFISNKRDFLTPKVDVYAFGAMIINALMSRYPTKEDYTKKGFKASFDKELIDAITTRFGKQLTNAQKKSFAKILKDCVKTLIIDRISMSQLVKQLEKFASDLEKDPYVEKRVIEESTLTSTVISENPLFNYLVEGPQGKEMKALMVGDDHIVYSMMSTILSSAHMLNPDYQMNPNLPYSIPLNVYLVVPDAKNRLMNYMKNWPLLKKTCKLYYNNQPVHFDQEEEFELDLDIVDANSPLASIYFYEETTTDLISLLQEQNIRYITISYQKDEDGTYTKNRHLTCQLGEYFSSSKERYVINLLDEKINGINFDALEDTYSNIKYYQFSIIDTLGSDEEEFKEQIVKKAFILHKYYSRDYSRDNDSELRKDFKKSSYNFNSSIASALSIPYKLESIGIDSTQDVSMQVRQYTQKVFSADSEATKTKLIWLEHRRWLGFMLTSQYDRPDENTVLSYAFKGENDQRDKVNALHICCAKSDPNKGLELAQLEFAKDQWDHGNLATLKAQLDALDYTSVWFHQLCNELIEQRKEEGIFDEALKEVASYFGKGTKKSYIDLVSNLIDYTNRLINGEGDILNLWNDTIDALSALKNEFGKDYEKAIKQLKNAMKIVKERNSYKDYKKADDTILKAIPSMIMLGHEITTIHKIAGDDNWENLASSILVEPKHLIIYRPNDALNEEQSEELCEFYHHFLANRGIETKVSIRSIRDLEIKAKDVASSLIDLTGCLAEDAFAIQFNTSVKDVPIVIFKNNQLHSINPNSPYDYKVKAYELLNRSMNVKDVFDLHKAFMSSQYEKNNVLILASNYQKIWKALEKMGSVDYTKVCQIISDIEYRHYWKLEKENPSATDLRFEASSVPYDAIEQMDAVKVLEELAKYQFIKSNYSLPKRGNTGKVVIYSQYENVIHYLEAIFNDIKSKAWEYKYRFIHTLRNIRTGDALDEAEFYIYEDTLCVNETVGTYGFSTAENGRDAFNTLFGYKSVIEEGVVEAVGHKIKLNFKFKNEATKQCLMKAGNALEALVYHTIRQYINVDDVKVNVEFLWNTESMEEYFNGDYVRNEIDIVVTKGIQTFFISCKQSAPDKAYLEEIIYHAEHFGVNGKAILITTSDETYNRDGTKKKSKLVPLRSALMENMYYIDRSLLGDFTTIQQNLVALLKNIIDGKKDWETI